MSCDVILDVCLFQSEVVSYDWSEADVEMVNRLDSSPPRVHGLYEERVIGVLKQAGTIY